MNIKAIALASILGISTPVIADMTLFPQASMAEIVYPEGLFRDGEWDVRLEYINGMFTYSGSNSRTGDSLRLNVSEAGGSPQRYTYTFRNGAHRYIVAYRPNDPDTIRLQVINPNGTTILNRLMTRVATDPQVIYPSGYFKDDQWGVRLEYRNGEFNYFGERFGSADYLELSGAEVAGNSNRYTYTFRNAGYRYIIAYRPYDEDIVRLQVMDPNGLMILNRLLTYVGDDFDI